MKCIICNEVSSTSKEHIIPEALGNEGLCTNRVCVSCNSKLGLNIDSYITNHTLIKLIRKQQNITGKDGKSVKIFKGSEFSLSNEKYIFKEDVPTLAPSVLLDNDTLRISASDMNVAIELAKQRLKREGLSDKEISTAISNIRIQTTNREPPVFELGADIHINRLLIFAIKIAYEYAHKTIGDQYLNDEIAIEFRKMLSETINAPKDKVLDTVNSFEYKRVRLSSSNNATRSPLDIIMELPDRPPIRHLIYIFSNKTNQIVCSVYIFMLKAFSFDVLISQEASKYINGRLSEFIAILEDGTYISF